MSTAPAPARDAHPPLRLAVASGVQATFLVGGLALMTAGHGIAGWGLMMVGGFVVASTHLRWLTWDRGRRRTWRGGSRAAGFLVVLCLLAVLGGSGLAARALAVEHPAFAAAVAVAAGVGFGALARWWHRRLAPAAR